MIGDEREAVPSAMFRAKARIRHYGLGEGKWWQVIRLDIEADIGVDIGETRRSAPAVCTAWMMT